MNPTHKHGAHARAGVKLLRAWAACLCLFTASPLWAVKDNKEDKKEVKSDALIQIAVEVAEVDNQKTQKIGIQWLNTLNISEAQVPALLTVGTLTRDQLMVTLQALIQEGAADLLANPKLVTRDGTTASFHAGGELPYATTSGSAGSVSVEFKPYGVNLKISPHLEKDNRIAISFDAEVSGPDDQNSVTLSGNTVPGLRSRQVSSEVTMGQGNTLTVAGLIQNQKQWTVVGVPGLMRIPLLGYLFRHKTQTNQRTSIVVFITPTVLASDNTKPQMPTGALFPAPEISKETKVKQSDEFLDATDSVEPASPYSNSKAGSVGASHG